MKPMNFVLLGWLLMAVAVACVTHRSNISDERFQAMEAENKKLQKQLQLLEEHTQNCDLPRPLPGPHAPLLPLLQCQAELSKAQTALKECE